MSEPVVHGPQGWPERTLFWPAAQWTARYLTQPDGPNAGRPWEFTAEQARFVAWWFAVDRHGRWLFRRGTLRRCKGWGKDPVGAVLCAIEFAGPCRFDGWAHGGEVAEGGYVYGPGEPMAVPHSASWVQTFAVSRDQTRNTMRVFPGLLSKRMIDEYAVDENKEIIYGRQGRSVIEAVTSSPDSAEGPRVTFVLRTETQNWRSTNGGHGMAEVIDGNLAKSRDGSARALSICNAHVPGEDSVGEREWDAYQQVDQGRSKATGILYDAREAPPDTDLADEDSLRTGLEAARGDSDWLDVDRLVGEVWDPRTPPSEARRKHLNQVVAAEDAWVAPHEWDRLADASRVVADGELVALGFDGSTTDDHTALMGCCIDDGYVFTIGVWDPDEHPAHEHCAQGGCGEAPRDLIDAAVQWARERYDVVAFFADLHPWESYVDKWADEFGRSLCAKATEKHPIAWDMRGRQKQFTLEGAERVHNEITEEAFAHDGDSRVRQHVHNARRRPNAWGVSFGKENRESSRKVDALAAGTLARMARRAYLALPRNKQRRQKSGRAAFV